MEEILTEFGSRMPCFFCAGHEGDVVGQMTLTVEKEPPVPFSCL
jgi:hypothetical protein